MGASGRPNVLHRTTSTLPTAGGKGTERQKKPAYQLIYASPGFLQWPLLVGDRALVATCPAKKRVRGPDLAVDAFSQEQSERAARVKRGDALRNGERHPP